ncbi:hypothetical protein Hamer_G015615 [Homarus americanus]|uniref:Uncharacterized protein n=1 Tax=Homarus americanus TaxID=6706 RepID=A0A8J5MKR8_HOMAM|nr:hypothetical protein Hamer_G015615 [Homarus americanus]
MLRKNNRYLSDLPPADEECSARQNKTSSTANKQVLERDKTLKMMRSTSQATRCNVSSPVSSVTRIPTKVTRSSSSATVDLQSLSEDESSNSSP